LYQLLKSFIYAKKRQTIRAIKTQCLSLLAHNKVLQQEKDIKLNISFDFNLTFSVIVYNILNIIYHLNQLKYYLDITAILIECQYFLKNLHYITMPSIVITKYFYKIMKFKQKKTNK